MDNVSDFISWYRLVLLVVLIGSQCGAKTRWTGPKNNPPSFLCAANMLVPKKIQSTKSGSEKVLLGSRGSKYQWLVSHCHSSFQRNGLPKVVDVVTFWTAPSALPNWTTCLRSATCGNSKTHHGLVSKQEDPQNWFVFLVHIYSHPKKHSTRGFGPAGQEPDIHVPQRQAPRYGQKSSTQEAKLQLRQKCVSVTRGLFCFPYLFAVACETSGGTGPCMTRRRVLLLRPTLID